MAGYGSDGDMQSYWTAAGYTFANDAKFASLRQQGSVYVDGTYGMRFPGQPTDGLAQERAWPRTGAVAYGASLASDLIPQRVVSAAYEAAYLELKKPGSLSVSFDPSRKVKRQKVEGIEREFFEPGAPDFGRRMHLSQRSSKGYLRRSSGQPFRSRPFWWSKMGFYDEMAEMVTELLQRDDEGGLGQGTVQLKRATTVDPDPATPWMPSGETTTFYPLDAAVKRVDQRYENGVLIVQTGDIVTFAVPEIVPAISDTLIIDGVERVITSLRPTPSAGTVVAYKAFVAV